MTSVCDPIVAPVCLAEAPGTLCKQVPAQKQKQARSQFWSQLFKFVGVLGRVIWNPTRRDKERRTGMDSALLTWKVCASDSSRDSNADPACPL